MIWKRCIFCGEEIFSITYKPIELTLTGIGEDEKTKTILLGFSHKSCRNHFNLELTKLIEKMIKYPNEEEGEFYIQ